MKVGLIARAEDRGLGHLTWEWARHMRPDRTLVVDLGDLARGFPPHLDRYPGAAIVRFGDTGQVDDEATVRDFLDGLDVVYSAETFYDWRIVKWARDVGCVTVCHVMPEFFNVNTESADVLWAPTSWRLDQLPARTRLVPVPVPTDRWPALAPHVEGKLRWLHVAGHRAAMDRNGTSTVGRSTRLLTQPQTGTVITQDVRMPPMPGRPFVQITTVRGGCGPDYWRMYDGHDVLVLPRRYGGLSLPAIEAMGAGLAVVMPDVEPQRSDWPVIRVPAKKRTTLDTQGGTLDVFDVDPRKLAGALDQLARDPGERLMARAQALSWANANSWAMLEPTIRAELARAAG